MRSSLLVCLWSLSILWVEGEDLNQKAFPPTTEGENITNEQTTDEKDISAGRLLADLLTEKQKDSEERNASEAGSDDGSLVDVTESDLIIKGNQLVDKFLSRMSQQIRTSFDPIDIRFKKSGKVVLRSSNEKKNKKEKKKQKKLKKKLRRRLRKKIKKEFKMKEKSESRKMNDQIADMIGETSEPNVVNDLYDDDETEEIITNTTTKDTQWEETSAPSNQRNGSKVNEQLYYDDDEEEEKDYEDDYESKLTPYGNDDDYEYISEEEGEREVGFDGERDGRALDLTRGTDGEKSTKNDRDTSESRARRKRRKRRRNGGKRRKCNKACRRRRIRRRRQNLKKRNKRQREQTAEEKVSTRVSGVSTMKRNGNVKIQTFDGKECITAKLDVGPLSIQAERKIRTQNGKEIKTSSAKTSTVKGKLVLCLTLEGASLKSLHFEKPTITQTSGNLGKPTVLSSGKSMQSNVSRAPPLILHILQKIANEVLTYSP